MPNPLFPGQEDDDTPYYHHAHFHRVILKDLSPPSGHAEQSAANADMRDHYSSAHESLQQASFKSEYLARDVANARGYLDYLESERAQESRAGVPGLEETADQQRRIDEYKARREKDSFDPATDKSVNFAATSVASTLKKITIPSPPPPPIVTCRKHFVAESESAVEGFTPRLIGANSEVDADSVTEVSGLDPDCFSFGVSPDGIDGAFSEQTLRKELVSPLPASLQQFMQVRDRGKVAVSKDRAASVPEELELDPKRTRSGHGPRSRSNSLTGV